MVRPESDLVLGEDHPPRDLAAKRPLLERAGEAGEVRAGQPHRDRRADAEVPGAADDLLRVAVADVDLAELEPVGVRVRVGGKNAADDEVAEVAVAIGHPHVDHALDLERRDRQPSRHLARGRRRLDVLAQPGDGHSHR